MKLLWALAVAIAPLSQASPARRVASPIVTISSPQATIIGGERLGIEVFPGIPFAKPPVGPLRLKPPQPLTEPLGTYEAKENGKACPQFFFSTELDDAIPTTPLGKLMTSPLFQEVLNAGEDCLHLNIHRPVGTTEADNLPVLFWIYGGGFELGWNSLFDIGSWVTASVKAGKPIIAVAVNYRVGGWGFLPGKEVLADGSANLGLLDQRLGLQWIADNIAAFGGNPDEVTIWGESAGSISVFDHMVMYDGDHTYKGKPLFRGGIMNSGSVVPADPVDTPKGQVVYDTVVGYAGCAGSADTLNCLREADYETLLHAMNSVPGILSYSSIALSYLPRPDGTILTKSPDELLLEGKIAKVPFILGSQEDEGTLFALFQSNITTKDQLATYLKTKFFHSASDEQITELIATYSSISEYGAPHRTGLFNNWYPQFKRLAAILGDLTFTLTRRSVLDISNMVHPDVPTWSYLSSYGYGLPVLGTFHGSDLVQVFFGIFPNYASRAFHEYYLAFVHGQDPNSDTKMPTWPRWSESRQLLNMYDWSSKLIPDNFRQKSYEFILKNVRSFHI
ncbi:triacylglycerol lipase [[Emmonsia] crescens]|uniref:Carboxylic ester hydrolase n=1 Tax=[Emmonsia] crescens TaxID=73230 RepID=A0A0G2HY13_9EURO|nr:triacylglycerol lipase [Emmonsia crescens UAMH 3008]